MLLHGSTSMSSSETLSRTRRASGSPAAGQPGALSTELSDLLDRAFATHFTVFDGATGEVLHAPEGPPLQDWGLRGPLCCEVARRGRPEFIDDEDPFLVLAIPFAGAEGQSYVAVGAFLGRSVRTNEDLSHPATLLGMPADDARAWASQQHVGSPEALQRVSELVLAEWNSRRRIAALEHEARSLSIHLASTYEEISLLYRLTQNLRISESDEDLGRVALEWLEEVLPAKGLALQLLPGVRPDWSLDHEVRTEPILLTHGNCPVDQQQFTVLIAHVAAGAAHRPVVANCSVTGQQRWPCPQVRQMIAVPLAEGENLFGWLAALNHVDDAEFGTVEASLLSSVAAILGIHSGNIELYRQQSELLAGIVRALTSAVDAKDPYTCGHSDRVARVAVRLAEELGCDAKTLNTLYLSGLLHDVGKIGTDDNVLRKAGKLSPEEYEHIKKHVEIGHRILRDLSKLEGVLPVVLHHHESWDGGGYPQKLQSQRIPLTARIVAVADAFDAMCSDRPYRQGMPDEKIDEIFRAGSGQQWDPEVVAAFFRVRDDIRRISRAEQTGIQVNAQHCT